MLYTRGYNAILKLLLRVPNLILLSIVLVRMTLNLLDVEGTAMIE